jgi:hypothetical protein
MHQLGEQVVFAPAQPFTCEVIAPAAVERVLTCVGAGVCDETIDGARKQPFVCVEVTTIEALPTEYFLIRADRFNVVKVCGGYEIDWDKA